MLFCSHEGDETELQKRRVLLFELFLRPVLLRCAEGPVDKEHKKLIMRIAAGMAGPPQYAAVARRGYGDEYAAVLVDANAKLEALYGEAQKEALVEPGAEVFFAQPKKFSNLPDDE